MKRLLSLMALLVAGTVMFTACNDDDDAEPELQEPRFVEWTVFLEDQELGNVDEGEHQQWDSLTFQFTARADEGLSTLTVTEVTEQTTTLIELIEFDDGDTFEDETFPYIIEPEDITRLEFVIEDQEGQTVQQNYNITIEEPGTPMENYQAGEFFHIEGPDHGAYDLVDDQTRGIGDDDNLKDMINNDDAGEPFTGSWESGLGNGTLYVQDNTFDFDNATVEAAQDSYDNGTPSQTVENPEADDIYIARIRGEETYMAIQITEVDPDHGDPTTNQGRIQFDYVKE